MVTYWTPFWGSSWKNIIILTCQFLPQKRSQRISTKVNITKVIATWWVVLFSSMITAWCLRSSHVVNFNCIFCLLLYSYFWHYFLQYLLPPPICIKFAFIVFLDPWKMFFFSFRSSQATGPYSHSPPHPPLLLFDLVLCNLIVVQFNLISLALFMIFSSVHHLDEHGIQLNFKSITGSGLCIPIADLILNFCCTSNKMKYVV